jgi:hypothetical protein
MLMRAPAAAAVAECRAIRDRPTRTRAAAALVRNGVHSPMGVAKRSTVVCGVGVQAGLVHDSIIARARAVSPFRQ